MRKILILSLLALVACGPNELEKKKAELKEHKNQILELNQKIAVLEEEISEMDPEYGRQNREATLITTLPVRQGEFTHYVEVSGSVQSRRNVTVSAEIMGKVENIRVTEGQTVNKGQTLISLDNDILRNNIKELETSLELAKTVFERQQNLWEKNIGTEIQYLQAKNNMESLERRLATTRSQLAQSAITAPFSGSIDRLFIREGEMAQPGAPLIRIVSNENMYIEADLSEAFIGKFEKGDKVEVTFPNLDLEFESTINAIGNVIDQNNRTFSIEVDLKVSEDKVKPNLLAVLRLKDFESENAVVIPSNLIQRDNRGYYVYVIDNSNSEPVAKKVQVDRGITYNNETLIKSGLTGNEVLINDGFNEVAEGHQVKVVENAI
jgi:RND family efflux transporter MFP subunit